MSDIKTTVRDFIQVEFLPGEDPANLTDDTQLLAEGILDSIATLKVVTFLEETFSIKVEAHETNEDNFSSIDAIEGFVKSKLGQT